MSERVTVYVDCDEWYPVWSAQLNRDGGRQVCGDPIEVDADVAARWAKVFADFELAQKEIADAARAPGGPYDPNG